MQLHEACVVPYLLTSSGVKFCLVSPVADNRWEFPKVRLEPTSGSLTTLLEQAVAGFGLRGSLQRHLALGYFEASRASQSHSMTGYLMQVVGFDETWPNQGDYRRLWCLAEEARVRIRRKPLRRFIDLALHSDSVEQRA